MLSLNSRCATVARIDYATVKQPAFGGTRRALAIVTSAYLCCFLYILHCFANGVCHRTDLRITSPPVQHWRWRALAYQRISTLVKLCTLPLDYTGLQTCRCCDPTWPLAWYVRTRASEAGRAGVTLEPATSDGCMCMRATDCMSKISDGGNGCDVLLALLSCDCYSVVKMVSRRMTVI